MSMINLTPTQLRQAADLKERIASLNQELTTLLGGSATPSPAKAVQPVVAKKRGMSAAGKARIAAAQKLRWAKVNAAKAKAVEKIKTAPAKPKRVISPAARAKMAAAAKLMWVKIKAAKAAKKK